MRAGRLARHADSRRPARLTPGGTDDDGDLLAAQRAAALSAAYHGGAGPVGFAWVRDRPGGPVQVLAAGPTIAVAGGGWDAVLKIPAGGRGEPAGTGGLAQALGPCRAGCGSRGWLTSSG